MSFIHANDAAMGDLGYDRVPLDHYPTPEWVTEAVVQTLKALRPEIGAIWEPACGNGAMSRVLERHYEKVWSTDVADYGFGQSGVDFLAVDDSFHSKHAIVTNPPYGDLAEGFIRKALRLTERHKGLVAMLVRHEYDTARGRVDLFQHPAFVAKLVLTTRPRWIEGSTGAPRHSYAWMFWDHQNIGAPRVLYHVRKGKPE